MNKNLIILIVIGVAILVGVYLLFAIPTPTSGPKDNDETVEVVTEIQKYFNEKLQEEVIAKTGQPIEGFVPFMFLNVFSGLVPQDFNGVDALLGEYEIVEKEIVFILDAENGFIHSAAEAISREGMETLLSNIQMRAQTSITTTEEIDGLLLFLGGTPEVNIFECTPEGRKAELCIQVFEPVCGRINVQCITTPCDPVFETFSNSCFACMNSFVESYTEGACTEDPQVQ